MTINFYLRNTKTKAKTALYVQVNYSGNKLKFYPGEAIVPEFWNFKTMEAEAKTVVTDNEKKAKAKKKINRFPQHMEFNQRLNKIKDTITTIYLAYKNQHNHGIPSPAVLKSLFDMSMKKGGGKITLIDYFKDFIGRTTNGQRMNPRSNKPVSDGAGKGYQTTLNLLIAFNKSWKRTVDFENIDLGFHSDFTQYLISAPRLHSANTCGSHIKKIKAVIGEATERGVNTNMVFKSRHFVKQREDSESIYLNESELQEMEKLDLSENPKLDKVRDIFLIGARTGLRFSDHSRLEPKNIINGMITITQSKTGRPVVIPVHPVVKSILKKYNDVPPKTISLQKMNEYIKEVGKKLDSLCVIESKTITKGGNKITLNQPKYSFLSSHTGRRSFCTNEYIAGTDVILLMQISSHKSSQAFLKYIKVTPQEHAQKLQAIWATRNNLRVA